MAEDLIKIDGTRADQYANLYPQIQSLLAGETDFVDTLTQKEKRLLFLMWMNSLDILLAPLLQNPKSLFRSFMRNK